MSIGFRTCFPVVICLSAVLLSACARRIVPAPAPAATQEAPRLDVKEIDFQYFKAKAKISYQDASANQTANVDLRMKRDTLIWMSISKVGIEGARVLITQDSAYVIDRLNNSYEAYDFKALGRKFNFNLSFDIIQAAVLGNLPVSKLQKPKLVVSREKDYYLLRQQQDSVVVENYVGLGDLKLRKALFLEPATNNSLSLNYDNFMLINDVLFPFNSHIQLQYKSPKGIYNTVVTIQYTKADVADKELRFPFNPPARRKQ